MAKFVVYEKVAEAIYQRVDKATTSSGMQTTINLGSGLLAGFAAALVSQPADTMLSKINKTKGLPGEGTTSRLIKIAKELGFRGSYTGIGARLFMVGTLTAGQFAIYGDIKKALGTCFLSRPFRFLFLIFVWMFGLAWADWGLFFFLQARRAVWRLQSRGSWSLLLFGRGDG